MPKKENKMMRRRLANAYLSSVISISLVLLLIGIAALIVFNAGSVSKYIKENMQISVLLKDGTDEPDALEYIDGIKDLPYVNTTHLVTREEGTKELEDMLGEDFLSIFETSPVPLSVDVTLKADYVEADSLSLVTSKLAESDLVDEVQCQQSLIETLTDNITKISIILGVFIALLLFISFVLINNMVRLSVFARRFTIHTMKLVGATRSFIRAPFLRSAVVQGLVASVIAVAALWGIIYAIRNSFSEFFAIFQSSTLIMVTATVVVCGVLICLVSTYFVVNKLVGASKDELYY